MPFVTIVFFIYFVVGLVLAIAVLFCDLGKNRLSVTQLLGDVSLLYLPLFFVFIAAWPLWATAYFLAEESSDEDASEQSTSDSTSSDQKSARNETD